MTAPRQSVTPLVEAPPELVPTHISEVGSGDNGTVSSDRAYIAARLLWDNRGLLFRVTLCGLLASVLVALLIPAQYESTTRLMPPENRSASGLASAIAAMSGGVAGLGGIASDMLELKSTSDVFAGILASRTARDKLIVQFDLKKVYRDRRMEDARRDLADHTNI